LAGLLLYFHGCRDPVVRASRKKQERQARVRLVGFSNLADERGPEEVMAKHPVPKKKTSKSKRDMRRSHHALVVPNLTTCKNCGSKKIQHVVCGSCGFYDGRQVLEISA
jgi:large subunit ribosomal protein L32